MGGLMQLVAYGAQDVYLTGEPQVTFFQTAYKRHSNFAIECIQQTVSGNSGPGNLVSVTIARNGDLVGAMHVVLQPINTAAAQLTSNNSLADMCWVAERAFTSIDLTIGGQSIDKHYQLWFRLYAEVFLTDTKKVNYGKMTSMSTPNNVGQSATSYVYLPLIFFFNRNPGLYLPLIALQFHEVRIDFTLSPTYNQYFGNIPIQVWGDFIFLDADERRKYAETKTEYLIEQVQHLPGDPVGVSNENTPSLIRLNFNHPVKELIWCYQTPAPTQNPNSMWNFTSGVSNVNVSCDVSRLASVASYVLPNWTTAPFLYVPGPLNTNLTSTSNISVVSGNVVQWSNISVQSNVLTGNVFWNEGGLPNYGTANTAYGFEVGPLHKFKVVLNGTDRFQNQFGKYFNQVQPYRYHSGSPYPGIYVYSFGLKPEELQPSGSCNFSRIDLPQVSVNLKSGLPPMIQQIFAVNYNILRIQSGMGGLAFSN